MKNLYEIPYLSNQVDFVDSVPASFEKILL